MHAIAIQETHPCPDHLPFPPIGYVVVQEPSSGTMDATCTQAFIEPPKVSSDIKRSSRKHLVDQAKVDMVSGGATTFDITVAETRCGVPVHVERGDL